MSSVRAHAARVVAQVLSGAALDGPLATARAALNRSQDGPLLAQLCFGTIRHAVSGKALIRVMLSKPGQKLKPELEALLLIGLEQIRFLRVPEHAAVGETVAAARELNASRSTGLINALLRRYLRERETLDAAVAQRDDARYEHPKWLLKALRQAWPNDWQQIVEANNTPAPLWLRVNLPRISREDYAALLREAGAQDVRFGEHAPSALTVHPPLPAEALPGFADGLVAVQDQSAQLAAGLLGAQSGERVLDACAAPGGKTAHLLESVPGLSVVAVDSVEARLDRLRENLRRQGHHATVLRSDVTKDEGWRAEGPFDRILLDAPCTGSGVIRRHPDIKLLRRASDAATLSVTQQRLLVSLWPALRPGGALLYATCSVLPAENDAVIARFLALTADATNIALQPASGWGVATTHGRQVFPGGDASDGFYYAYIGKRD